ncbi:hypothetical protein SAMN02982985_00419 [Rugamonas rubra]|uniref:Nickel/cobalt transporter regulator n=2 Tax=Telluria group TaxID=2895353 RepID=A0A1I4I2D4_9BURK|nr:hypothetical protein SAMN02982985_00419 [Rugamonas rubra]
MRRTCHLAAVLAALAPTLPTSLALGLTLALAPPLAATAAAQGIERPFPPDALRGKMTPGYFPDLLIDGKPRRLAAGARIFNQDNMIAMPATLRGSDIVVNYTVDAAGMLERVWILNDDEAARPAPAAAK